MEVNYERIIEFCKNLANRYNKSECLKYLAYHLAIGSTPKKEEIQYFDFSGEDAIENFLDKLLKEQKQEQEYRQKKLRYKKRSFE